MNMFIPRVCLLELKKLARAFFSLKPSHHPPNVELHPNGGETQLVVRRGDAVIALCLDSAVAGRPMSLPFSILDVGSRKGDVQVRNSDDANDTVELAWTDQDVPQRASYVTDLPLEPPVAPELRRQREVACALAEKRLQLHNLAHF